MRLSPAIVTQWREAHVLDAAACHWLVEHADAGDVHPIASAVVELRAHALVAVAAQQVQLAAFEQQACAPVRVDA